MAKSNTAAHPSPLAGRGSGVGGRQPRYTRRSTRVDLAVRFLPIDSITAIYRSLIAWQKAIDLACDIYTVAERFPNRERFVLAQQICDAAISVPSNIAEGRGRGTRRDFRNFLYYARASLYEVETQLTMARRLHYVTEQEEADLLERSGRVLRLINGLIRRLSGPDLRPPTRDQP